MSRAKGIRRSVSVRVETYWRLLQISTADGRRKSLSFVMEDLINREADRLGIPHIERQDAIDKLPQKIQDPTDPSIVSQHFTF